MRSDYERAVRAERERNGGRDPRSGTYASTEWPMMDQLSDYVRNHPLASVAIAKLCGLSLGLAIAAMLYGMEHRDSRRSWLTGGNGDWGSAWRSGRHGHRDRSSWFGGRSRSSWLHW
jgi:hypothetical protein